MDLADVNVLVYAHRLDASEHGRYADWLRRQVAGPGPFALSELALSGFVRVVTNPKIFKQPTPTAIALAFCGSLLAQSGARCLRPGPDHWRIFDRLCTRTGACGKLVADAYHAALAIEHGCDWITTDGDFARFPDLRTRHPLAE
ncbi:MAG: type II toxin-antitoxin system VapC family toxin [Myxococcales bacterium]|nr:type II toxin-antitoxin system VapC family toxin [Myxococcales bacterium]